MCCMLLQSRRLWNHSSNIRDDAKPFYFTSAKATSPCTTLICSSLSACSVATCRRSRASSRLACSLPAAPPSVPLPPLTPLPAAAAAACSVAKA